jgi:hypothetical protein
MRAMREGSQPLEIAEADEVVEVVVVFVEDDAVQSAAACRRTGWACKL